MGERHIFENRYTTKSDISKKISTPTGNGMAMKSGAYTTRTATSESTQPVLLKSERKVLRKGYGGNMSSSETRRPKMFSKKLRTKSRGENIPTKENSSTSSKNSNKCLSNLSKSNSRKKDKVGSSKHFKKKSVVIPTRKTKALYSNKSEYEKKRNSKATSSIIKPSSSAANLDTKKINNSKTGFSQIQKSKATAKTRKLKYLTNNEESKSKPTLAAKTTREKGKLIEFKLHDSDFSNPKLENSKSSSTLTDSHMSSIRRLYATKSQKLFTDTYSKTTSKGPKAASKGSNGCKQLKHKYVNKARPKTSRNPALKSYKEVHSKKTSVDSKEGFRRGEMGVGQKTVGSRPNQVKIYLKEE